MPLSQWHGLNEAPVAALTDVAEDDNGKDSFEAQESNIKARYERALRLLAAGSAPLTQSPFAPALASHAKPLHDDAYHAFSAVLDEPLIRRVAPRVDTSDSDASG
jgi:hypothetical protein